jgi:hypothetical protein
MHPDFKELLSTLNAENVRYLIVGAYAVSLHAQPRATKDLDIFIKADPENGVAVFRALAAFGAPLEGLTARDFAERGSFFRMGVPPLMVDILPEIDGIDFETAWSHRVIEVVDASMNLSAPFISADDLITNKGASGRAQDVADIAAVKKAQAEKSADQT